VAVFTYRAKDKDGKEKSGFVEAASKNEAAGQLRQEGFFITFLDSAEKQDSGGRFLRAAFSLFSRVSLAEKMIFARHLSTMIRAGLSLDRGLQILAAQTKNSRFRKILTAVETSVRGGQSFSESLAKYPDVFSDLFVSMIKIAEASGNLEGILNNLAVHMEKDHELRSKVRGAMVYPSVIVSVMVGIGILMMTMVVPKLASTFEELGVELPWTTNMVIKTSQFLSSHFVWGLILLILFIFFLRIIMKTSGGKKFFDFLILSFPLFSQLSKKINSARFSRNLSSLVDAGVPIMTALQITAQTISNSFFRDSLIFASSQIQKGDPLSKILQGYGDLYPVIVIQMIEVGETTGSLSEILRNLADFYEEEVNTITKNLSSIIEPVLMVIIGVVVGFFAISMIQPLYSIMNQI
jgi:type IV pilus assembly protein PilC